MRIILFKSQVLFEIIYFWAQMGKKLEIYSISLSHDLNTANLVSQLIFVSCASSSTTARPLDLDKLTEFLFASDEALEESKANQPSAVGLFADRWAYQKHGRLLPSA